MFQNIKKKREFYQGRAHTAKKPQNEFSPIKNFETLLQQFQLNRKLQGIH